MERKTAKKPNPFIQGIATFLNGWKEKQQKKTPEHCSTGLFDMFAALNGLWV
jgi:hypothetical protein